MDVSPPLIAEPPAEVIEFLSRLRVPPGSSAEEIFTAQGRAMLEQPWPKVGAISKREPISADVELTADVILPEVGTAWPLLLYVHGGGWVDGSPGTHRRIASEFAARGFATVVPRYRLAPAARHPAQLDDLDAVLDWSVENLPGRAVDVSRIAVAGDSAGAHLAAAMAVRRKLAGAHGFGAAILLTGIFEYHDGLSLVGPYGHDEQSQPLLLPSEFDVLRDDPVINPLRGAHAMPPSFIGTGGADPFASQSSRMAEAMSAKRIPVELDLRPGGPHLCHLLPGLSGTAASLDRAAAWAHSQL
jgi:acetyl esterase